MKTSLQFMEALDAYVASSRNDASFELEMLFVEKLDRDSFRLMYDYMETNFEMLREADIDSMDVIFANDNARLTVQGEFEVREYCRTDLLRPVSAAIRKEKVSRKDLDEYNLRFRASREIDLDDEEKAVLLASYSEKQKLFRKKRRYSFRSKDHPGLRVDLTMVRQSKKPCLTIFESGVMRAEQQYEFEVELEDPKAGSDREISLRFMDLAAIATMVSQDTDHVLTRSETLQAIVEYVSMVDPALGKKRDQIEQRARRQPRELFLTYQPVTLERDNMRDDIVGGVSVLQEYTVTDKADGERMLLFVDAMGKPFLINNRMRVRYLGGAIPEYAKTLLDGEFVRRDKFGSEMNLYAIFDVYFNRGKDVRSEVLVPHRVDQMKHVGEALSAGLSKEFVRIRSKKFLHGKPLTEMARVAYEETSYPYAVDGLILTPADLSVGAFYKKQPLAKNKFSNTWRRTFKWKPPKENSIDMLVVFQESKVQVPELGLCTAASLNVAFQSSKDVQIDPYEALDRQSLAQNSQMIPYRFTTAYLPLGDRGVPVTMDDTKIINKSIVEFMYDENALHPNARWRPMRVRLDKTQLFARTGKIAGAANSYTTAMNVWRSIQSPVTGEMIVGREEVPRSESTMEDSDVYYARSVKREESLMYPMNVFHNKGVKLPLFREARKAGGTRLLEVACGKAGDLNKWTQVGFKHIVGVDSSEDNLLNSNDGAYRRLMQAPRDRPSVLLLQKDMSRSWHTHNEIESASLRSLYDIAWGKTHKDALQRSPAREFHNTMNTPMDVVSCQFAIHYFFRTEESLDTFCANVSSVLRPGGYFIGTHMDGARVHARLQSASNGQVEGRLNDNLLWRIARRYEPSTPLDELSKPGQRISVYLESINRASDEFLVFRETLVEALEKHGLRPAESEFDLPASGLFRDIYDPQLFTVHETLKEFSFLNRWFVFKKVA